MFKKVTALAMAIALCMSVAVAFATGSITTQDVVATEDTAVSVTAPTAESKAEMDAIAAFVNNGEPVVNYFDDTVKSEIVAAVPEGVAETLKMDEFFPLASDAPLTGVTEFTLSTAATYTDTDAVVVLVGVSDGEKVVWQVVPATIVDGKIVVTLSADVSAKIADGNVMLTVLSDKSK